MLNETVPGAGMDGTKTLTLKANQSKFAFLTHDCDYCELWPKTKTQKKCKPKKKIKHWIWNLFSVGTIASRFSLTRQQILYTIPILYRYIFITMKHFYSTQFKEKHPQ